LIAGRREPRVHPKKRKAEDEDVDEDEDEWKKVPDPFFYSRGLGYPRAPMLEHKTCSACR